MMSNSHPQRRQNCEHNVFAGVSVRPGEQDLLQQFLGEHDLSPHTREALVYDLRKFACWFVEANREPFSAGRITVRDAADFRDHLREEKGQAVATVNRSLSSLRKYLRWLTQQEHLARNPAASVRELRRQPLAPKGLDRAEVRRLMREVELRNDLRAQAIFSLILYTGARLGDVVNLELADLLIAERSGHAVFRYGKGSKQRSVPLPLQARKALSEYLASRPPIPADRVFVGERGPLNARGVQAVFEKYRPLTGIRNLHPHVLRHTFSHRFLAQGGNLVQLAQILGHESLQTTQVYVRESMEQLADAAERLSY